jgi:hypothetical protein
MASIVCVYLHLIFLVGFVSSFSIPTQIVVPLRTRQERYRVLATIQSTRLAFAAVTDNVDDSTTAAAAATSRPKRIVVVSPPGGIGEVTAVQAAQRGSSVRWLVVTPDSDGTSTKVTATTATAVVALSQETFDRINAAGGSLEFAGADVLSLLLAPNDSKNDESSAVVSAISTWCGEADALVATFDGVEQSRIQMISDTKKLQRRVQPEDFDPTFDWKDAIKVAAREAAKGTKGIKIAILSTSDADGMIPLTTSDKEADKGILDQVGNLFGKSNPANIPSTLSEALTTSTNDDDGTTDIVVKLRHGQLFGLPESSPDFTPFVGGPRRTPELCEEYVMRRIRVDPTLTVAGNVMMGKTTRSSRHAVGEAAALMILDQVPIQSGLDVCVSSQQGMDPFTVDEWMKEFQRVETVLASGEAAELFAVDFASVPNIERFADWIATKWAPAVLRTYDIAAIRTGARPVYANRAGPGRIEIVWQQLVNYDPVTVGRMYIQIADTGMKATRGPGDTTKGFGSLSLKPLAGEDVLVRRLAEAASQAVEKGLANKVRNDHVYYVYFACSDIAS